MPRRREYTSELTGWANLVTLDPGGTTGWAVMGLLPRDVIGTREVHKAAKHIASGQITGTDNVQCMAIADLLDTWPDAAVCAEDFIIRKYLTHRGFLAPTRITAAVRFYLHQQGRYLFTQQPSLAMGHVTDERLKAMGLYKPGNPHACDALRHAITFFDRARDKTRFRTTAWPLLFDDDGTTSRHAPPARKANH